MQNKSTLICLYAERSDGRAVEAEIDSRSENFKNSSGTWILDDLDSIFNFHVVPTSQENSKRRLEFWRRKTLRWSGILVS